MQRRLPLAGGMHKMIPVLGCGDAYTHQTIGTALVQIMVLMPLRYQASPEVMVTYYQLDP